jgi:SAM-dependent methyltransferase
MTEIVTEVATEIVPEIPTASAYWSKKKGYAPNWYSFCSEVIFERITGNPKHGPSSWALNRLFSGPVRHLLEIGCLQGDKLAAFQAGGNALRFSGVDIAEGAIAAGREKWGDRINLQVMDLNAPTLPVGEYSAIHANGVLHHITNLEICVQSLYDALEPYGALIATEFTGPQRYRYSSKEIRLIREGQQLLPEALRGAPFDSANLTLKLDHDPSESVRTRDIELVLRATFDQVEAFPFGGNVLMRALTPAFFEQYNAEDPVHREALERLVRFDTEVSKCEPSHHHFFIAKKFVTVPSWAGNAA